MDQVKPVNVGDGWESKSIYLKREGEQDFIGLHSTGVTDENNEWRSMEAWLNIYDQNGKFICSNSRIFEPIENLADELILDGWQLFTLEEL